MSRPTTKKIKKNKTKQKSKPITPSFWRILFFSLFIVALLAIGVNFLVYLNLWLFIAFILVISLFIARFEAYLQAIGRTVKLSVYLKPNSRFVKLLSGRFFINLLIFIAAVPFSLCLFLSLASLNFSDWLYVLLTIPAYLILYSLGRLVLKREVASWLLTPFSARFARFYTPLLMVLIFGLSQTFLTYQVGPHSFAEAQSTQIKPLGNTISLSLDYVVEWLVPINAFHDYTAAIAYNVNPYIFFGILVFTYWALFFALSSLFSYATISSQELTRVYSRPSFTSPPKKGKVVDFFLKMVLPASLVVFVFVYGVVSLELWLGSSTGSDFRNQHYPQALGDSLVLVEDRFFKPEYIVEVSHLSLDFTKLSDTLAQSLSNEVNLIYAGYESNVDAYLDWFYSLKGEYSRLLAFSSFQLEDFMRENMMMIMGKNVDVSKVTEILKIYGHSLRTYYEQLEFLKNKYAIESPVNANVLLKLTSTQFARLINPPETLSFKFRLALSSGLGVGAGLVTFFAVKRLVGKIVQKLFYRTAIKILGEAALKSASTLGGSVIGGATGGGLVGSIFGPVGTGVGAVVGTVAGLGAGLLIDKGLIELDEALNRQEFRQNLLNAIREQRNEAIGSLSLT
ncbi:MAG: hypothetical protein LBF22_09105 [Deltaproteobacteria bacterium]|jgi:hypothetical protein|nr:hypothetical protein [Deltaproteobacteria bacterium]